MKAARRPLFWFNFMMWVLSLVISVLFIQLGSLLMSDLPTAAKRINYIDFVDTVQFDAKQAEIEAVEAQLAQNSDDTEDAEFRLTSRSADYQNQRATFENWIKTRTATTSDDQNPEVIARVRVVEQLKLAEREAQKEIETLRQDRVETTRRLQDLRSESDTIYDAAQAPFQKARNTEILKVFMLRLAMTLPLLAISAGLILKKRTSNYWPIYRGFVLFSLFAFFVELVPYMPSYGGYVRTIVGIALTLVFAHFAIGGMKRYVARKQSEEKQSETEKRKLITYETAIKKIADCQCPSCDRQFGAGKGNKEPTNQVDFCVHCGFCLFSKCNNCGTRENSFYKFCGTCGVASDGPATDPA